MGVVSSWWELVVGVLGIVLGSSGLWAYLSKVHERDDGRDRLMKGLAQVVISQKANEYIARGSITPEEFATIYNLVYAHYKELGGNGGAERLMKELEALPITKEN